MLIRNRMIAVSYEGQFFSHNLSLKLRLNYDSVLRISVLKTFCEEILLQITEFLKKVPIGRCSFSKKSDITNFCILFASKVAKCKAVLIPNLSRETLQALDVGIKSRLQSSLKSQGTLN